MFFFIIKQIRVLGKYCKKWQGTQSTDKMHRTFIQKLCPKGAVEAYARL